MNKSNQSREANELIEWLLEGNRVIIWPPDLKTLMAMREIASYLPDKDISHLTVIHIINLMKQKGKTSFEDFDKLHKMLGKDYKGGQSGNKRNSPKVS